MASSIKQLAKGVLATIGGAPYSQARQTIDIDVKKILASGEDGISSNRYARLIGDPLRSSRSVLNGPHLDLLRRFRAEGEDILSSSTFRGSRYYLNAAQCMEYTGHYFAAKRRSEIVEVAKAFIEASRGQRPATHTRANGHNLPDDPIRVMRIANSDCVELLDGNHRLASQMDLGQERVQVQVVPGTSQTPLQDMLLDVLWQGNRIELYQPIDSPEVSEWPLVRQCTDRADLIRRFVEGKSFDTSVDVGCSYGWFVREFADMGIDAFGVDRDPFSLRIGEVVYGIKTGKLIRSDIVDWLESADRKYSIVSCFSVAHHFALGRASVGVDQLFRLLDKITDEVLFFDTGEGREEWFRESLAEWTVSHIVDFVKKNTTFSNVISLGVDRDNRGSFANNYGRTLFACTR